MKISTRFMGARTSSLGAALLLHLLLLAALVDGSTHVQVARPGVDRSSDLVEVTVNVVPPVMHRVPGARPNALASVRSESKRTLAKFDKPVILAKKPSAARVASQPPSNEDGVSANPAAMIPVQAPWPVEDLLNGPATRQAVRGVARASTLASRGNDLIHEARGSELLAADGSHDGDVRHLAPTSSAERERLELAAAHKGDCLSGQYYGSGMGLPSLPFLLAAEALGKCAHKL